MKRLMMSCELCRRNIWVDFEGDHRALEPIVHQAQSDHRIDEFCPGKIVTAVVDLQPIIRLKKEERANG